MAQRYQERLKRCEAMKVTADNLYEVAAWCGGFANPQGETVFVPTGGVMIPAQVGQYVVQHPAGHNVLDGEQFESEWEPVPEA